MAYISADEYLTDTITTQIVVTNGEEYTTTDCNTLRKKTFTELNVANDPSILLAIWQPAS